MSTVGPNSALLLLLLAWLFLIHSVSRWFCRPIDLTCIVATIYDSRALHEGRSGCQMFMKVVNEVRHQNEVRSCNSATSFGKERSLASSDSDW